MSKEASYVSVTADRGAVLRATQSLKMARSSHAFVRGSTMQFYRWLARSEYSTIPRGPAVWICGDCHSGNLGPVASADGDIDVQIRDLDQSVVGNPSHDLIRLALSLASAARGSDLPGVTTAIMIERMVAGYERALGGRTVSTKILGDKPHAIRVVIRRAMGRTWRHLAEERLVDVRPTIPLGKRFWPLSKAERHDLQDLFAAEEVRGLVTSLKARKSGAPVELLDAAFWRKGCSSLGRLRYAVLLRVGRSADESAFCLMDVKEAIRAAAPRAPHAQMPRDNARRVVAGARQLAPYLGERMVPASIRGRSVVIRELMPQDLKIDIDHLTPAEAASAAEYLAAVVGRAHGRQMDRSVRRAWRRMLSQRRTQRLDAPSWLWSNVVALLSLHEAAYLEHCRAYARTLG